MQQTSERRGSFECAVPDGWLREQAASVSPISVGCRLGHLCTMG